LEKQQIWLVALAVAGPTLTGRVMINHWTAQCLRRGVGAGTTVRIGVTRLVIAALGMLRVTTVNSMDLSLLENLAVQIRLAVHAEVRLF